MTDTTLHAIPVTRTDELESPARRALRRLFQRKGAVVGIVVIVTFILLALFAPWILPYDPIAANFALVRKPPSTLHWFGTDELGRDVLVRVIYGARASLMAGVISVGIALSIGVPFGLLSGYRGGFVDALISRITDAMLACPFLILAIALAAFLGPSLGNAMIAIGITTTPIFVRLTRGQVMSVKVEDYVEAARAMGAVPHPAEYHAGAAGAGDAVDCSCDHRGSRAVVPGARPATARAIVGQHAQCRATFPHQRAVDGDLARIGDLSRSAVVQPGR
jgi:peptide/nickel transport system permease protein